MIGSVLGGLGGSAFRSSSAFFSLLVHRRTTCWVYFALAPDIDLGWMQVAIQRVMRSYAGELNRVEASH
jgi:hypothetical protein